MSKQLRFAVAVMAGVIPSLSVPVRAHAQKPVITASADEPGRHPYHSFAQLSYCASICTFEFDPVPAGYRLVVTQVSAEYQNGTPQSSAYASAGYQIDEEQFYPLTWLPVPTPVGGTSSPFAIFIVSTPVMYFVEAGQKPNIRLYGVFRAFMAKPW